MARHSAPARWIVALSMAGLFVLGPAAPALAHGGEGDSPARDLVIAALSYLANKPADYLDMAADKTDDALKAKDQQGVDLAKVKDAMMALDDHDPAKARTLLQASVQPMDEPATGMEPGTTVMHDPMPGHTDWAGSGVVYAVVSGLAVLVGLVFAVRWRPAESVAQLRELLKGDRR